MADAGHALRGVPPAGRARVEHIPSRRPPAQREAIHDLIADDGTRAARVQLVQSSQSFNADGQWGYTEGALFRPAPGAVPEVRPRPTVLAPSSRTEVLDNRPYDPTRNPRDTLRERLDDQTDRQQQQQQLGAWPLGIKGGDGVSPLRAGHPTPVLDWRSRGGASGGGGGGSSSPAWLREERIDPVDGRPRPRDAFMKRYGGTKEWTLAMRLPINQPEPHIQEEPVQRLDPASGRMLTKAQFLHEYGGLREWEGAGRPVHHAYIGAVDDPVPVEVRVDPVDGRAYTYDEFVARYARTYEWELAPRAGTRVQQQQQQHPAVRKSSTYQSTVSYDGEDTNTDAPPDSAVGGGIAEDPRAYAHAYGGVPPQYEPDGFLDPLTGRLLTEAEYIARYGNTHLARRASSGVARAPAPMHGIALQQSVAAQPSNVSTAASRYPSTPFSPQPGGAASTAGQAAHARRARGGARVDRASFDRYPSTRAPHTSTPAPYTQYAGTGPAGHGYGREMHVGPTPSTDALARGVSFISVTSEF